MTDTNTALTLQLLEWIAATPRTYIEVLDAWRSSCPRFTIWEDACIEGLIDRDEGPDRIVTLSPKGLALLRANRSDSIPYELTTRPQEPNQTPEPTR